MRGLLGLGKGGQAAVWCGLTMLASPADAQEQAQAQAQAQTVQDPAPRTATPPDVVVRGQREPDVAPIAVLDAEDIATYGADSVGDLLTALAPLTRSAGGGDGPIVLINGKRVSGISDIATLPPEAIKRMDIYPEEKALRLGYPPDRRVVNFIVLDKFRSWKANLTAGGTTEGGAGTREGTLTYTRIDKDRRLNFGLGYKGADALLESQRGVAPPPRPPYSFAGTLIDAAGTVAGTANGPEGDLAASRTLRGANDTLNLTAGIADSIGGTNMSLTGTLVSSWTRSLQGPAVAALVIPATNPFSTLDKDVTLNRYLGEAQPLRQSGRNLTTGIGLTADGTLGKFHWNAIARYDRTESRTTSERGLDTGRVQVAILAGDPTINPFTALPLDLLGARLTDRGTSTSEIATLNAMLSGPLVKLPAGDVFANVGVFGVANRAVAATVRAGTGLTTERAQDTETALLRLILPLTSRRTGILPWAGNLSANVTAGATRISQYGMLESIGYGGNWSIVSGLDLALTINDEEVAPPIDQLVAPSIAIPNVPIFDYQRGASVLVTSITGGNPGLKENRRHSLTAGVTLTPLSDRSLRISAGYVENTLHDPLYPLPAVTPAIEAAFPERFVRGADGTLLSIDTRPVNFARADRSEWTATLSFSYPPDTATAAAMTAVSGAPSPARVDKGNIVVDLSQIWRLHDDVQLRPGLPRLDLLGGNAIVASGGQPRHEVSLNIRASKRGIGLGVESRWKSGTRVVGSDPASNLTFSDLATVNTRLFADMGNLPPFKERPWAKGMRVSLDVTNVFDGHVDVRDGNGIVPIPYQPAYLDPFGRTVSLSLRKLI